MALVAVWIAAAAVITGAASGYWGNFGVPDAEDDSRPRGLLVIGVTTLIAGATTTVSYRRLRGPVANLLDAAERVATGDYEVVDIEGRGPYELRLLTETFNEMATRLAANEHQRRRFLADITHELRNPLAVLQNGIEAQLDGVHPRDDPHLASLLEETRRLGHLVDDLHTLTLAETGRLVLRRERTSLGLMVQELVERHGALATERDVALRTAVSPNLPDVWVDPARVRQVLDNLLANAIRHTPARSAVSIEVSEVVGADMEPTVRCQVTDAGPGFRHDQLGHMFERFVRAGDSHGSGLGLSIARDLVVAHGGTIEAHNDAHTGGATVSFALPVDPIGT